MRRFAMAGAVLAMGTMLGVLALAPSRYRWKARSGPRRRAGDLNRYRRSPEGDPQRRSGRRRCRLPGPRRASRELARRQLIARAHASAPPGQGLLGGSAQAQIFSQRSCRRPG